MYSKPLASTFAFDVFVFMGRLMAPGTFLTISELPCLFLNAQMESTIGVGPSRFLKISFQDHQELSLSKPDVCQ